MTTIIKNQIVKQLARFTKNLSPSKISLKFLKGEGELRNLELNENFLAELLELPPFIRLTRAVCNKISAKIHWTRLKTDPIRLFLDCVEVEMEMTENVQEHETEKSGSRQSSPTNPTTKPSEYGFVEKVVDGMHVTINSVVMAFSTSTFKATFQMSHLSVHSTDPNWNKATLRNTRIKDEAGKEVLTFKQITFGTLRVDADALYQSNGEKESVSSSPLRLITSTAKLNIVIKKKMEDCSVISARLHVILDDILWVLTHAQLRAVAGFAKSVVQVVEKSKKIEPAPSVASDDSMTSSSANTDQYHSPDNNTKNPSSLFQREDVRETSYRVTTGKIDIHLCDDSPMMNDGQSGGSMQIVVQNVAFEHYPYHLAFTSRVNWRSHNEASLTRAQWVQELFNSYKKVMDNAAKRNSQKSSTQKRDSPLEMNQRSTSREKLSMDVDSTVKKRSRVYLYECAFVISCEDFIIMPVTTNEKMSSGSTPFLCSDKKSLYLPSDVSALQFDYTLYFYPGQEDAKVPQPNLFCQLNPLHLTMDDLTCIWFHRFMQSIRSGFLWAEELIAAQGTAPRHIDVRIDGLMPKITLPCPSADDAFYDQFRPQGLQVYMSSFRASNTRIGSEFKQSELVNTLETFLRSKLYTKPDTFPNHADDLNPPPHLAWLNDFSLCSGAENTAEYRANGANINQGQMSVVWMLSTRQCWCDFIGIEESAGRPRPFIEPFPLRLCMCYPIAGVVQQQNYPRRASPSPAGRHLSRPAALPLHRSPSDPSRKNPRSYSNDRVNSARSTPASSPAFDRAHKSRSVTSVNIPILQSDFRPTTNMAGGELGMVGGGLVSRSESEGSSDSFFEEGIRFVGQHGASRVASTTLLSQAGQQPYQQQWQQTNRLGSSASDVEIRVEGSGEAEYGRDLYAGSTSGYTGSTPRSAGGTGYTGDAPGYGEGICGNGRECTPNEDDTISIECGLSILLNLPSILAVKLDHYQFVFLMRLQERFLTLRDVLFADVEKFESQRRTLQEGQTACTGVSQPDSVPGISVSLVSKGAELSLLVPAPIELEEPVAEGETGHEDSFSKERNERSSELNQNLSPRVGEQTVCVGGQSEVVGKHSESVGEQSECVGEQSNIVGNPCEGREDSIKGKLAEAEISAENNEWTFVDRDGQVRMSDDDEGHMRSCGDGPHQPSSSDASSTNVSDSEYSSQTGGSVASERSYHGRSVSAVTARAKTFECAVMMQDDDFAVKLLIGDCVLTESGQQNLEAFLSRKVKKDTSKKDASCLPQKASEIKVRYAQGSTVDTSIEGAQENGLAHVIVSDVVVEIRNSNLDGVLECVQDEVVLPPPFIPILIELQDVDLTLHNDKPPRLLSIPPSLPSKINVDNLTICRTAAGGMELKSRGSSELEVASSRVLAMRNENIRVCKDLDMAREVRESLETERDRLLLTVERLTEELVRSNRENDELHGILRHLKKNAH